jgi:hypothetical protein
MAASLSSALVSRGTAAGVFVTVAMVVALAVAGPSSGAAGTCGLTGAKRVASSGPLVVIVTADKSVEACIGRRPNFQLETLNEIDATCALRKVAASFQRFVGLDIHCADDLDINPEELVSFDVKRRARIYGSEQAGLEDVRGAVFAPGGAFAYLEDFGSVTDVIACDARTDCRSSNATPNRVLDHAPKGTIGGLAIHGTTVLWRHGTAHRKARLSL